ncbi:MAG: histidine phosphatase family protein, partial [Deltaproteobacteria bacterium]|nr:histidine phosphatase family protein [Deltaproteobacteria bacterium]
MTRVFLIRHGVVVPEARNRFNGSTEAALDPEGERQIKRLADYLQSAPPQALYTSPLERCLASAQVLAQAFSLEVRVEPDLKEMDFGQLDGLSFSQVRE